jgi:hypothetical protein
MRKSVRRLADEAAELARFLLHPEIDQQKYERLKRRLDRKLDKLVALTGGSFVSVQDEVYNEAESRGATLPVPGKDI